MKFTICVIVLLASLKETCSSAITIQTLQRDNTIDNLVEATNKVLTHCYEKTFETVGLCGNSTGTLLGTKLSKILPVISIDATTKMTSVKFGILRYKLEIFAILADSPPQLRRILREIKQTQWWNHMASFFILNRSSKSNNDCSKAFEFLWVAWKMNLLNVKFLCVHKENKVSLYSYNPYTETAPRPWKLWNVTKGTDDHPWSMFVREYQDDKSICDGLDYDRTRDLGGYPIRCSVQNVHEFWHTKVNETGKACFGGLDGTAAEMWFRTMNAEAILTTRDTCEPTIFLNERGEVRGVVSDLMDGTSDLVLNSYYFDDLSNFTLTYPHLEGGLGVATRLGRPRSELSKINSVIDVKSRYVLYSVMLITPLIVKFVMRKQFVPAVLDTVRVICNSGVTKLPDNPAARIFLATLFGFQITIFAMYSGQLDSLLTKPIYERNVDTMQDLAELGHTIYGHKAFAYLFANSSFKNRFVGLDDNNCMDRVLRDSTAACVDDWEMLRTDDFDPNLYLSRDKIKRTSLVNAMREDWPLDERLNKVIARTVENGILPDIYMKHSKKYSNVRKFNEKLRSQSRFEIIKLRELSFAFAILGFGLACATVVFVLEIIIDCWSLRCVCVKNFSRCLC